MWYLLKIFQSLKVPSDKATSSRKCTCSYTEQVVFAQCNCMYILFMLQQFCWLLNHVAGKFNLEKNFAFFTSCSYGRKFLSHKFSAHVNDYMVLVATHTYGQSFFQVKKVHV